MAHRRITALAAALALALAGCGGGDEKSSSDARTVAGDGFEIELPKGWQRTPQQTQGVLHLRVLDGRAQVGALTVRRLEDLPEGATLATLFETIRGQLLSTVPGLTPSDVGPSRPVSLDGTPARGYVARATVEGRKGVVRGLVTMRGAAAYTTVFAVDAKKAAQRLDDYRSILGSWRWTRAPAADDEAADDEAAGDEAAEGHERTRAAKGPPVTGSGYRFNLPRGWRKVRAGLPPGLKRPSGYVPPDVLVAGGTIDGVPVTASVLVESAGGRTLQDFLDGRGARYYGGDTPTETVLGGVPAVAALGERTGIRDLPVRTETWAAVRDGRAYVVDFSAPRDRFLDAHRAFRAAMASWEWR
jgi:hypothetical protein